MARLSLAFRLFFAGLFGKLDVADGQRLLAGSSDPVAEPATLSESVPKPAPAALRSEALTLLATLQREARFVDLVLEPLGEFTDEQIGAAARGVLSECATTLNRMFQLQPLVDAEQNVEIETPAEFDVACYRLSGNVTGDPPFRGRLVHHGWLANRCELPKWSGGDEASKVVAPAELEL
ncbi:MAG: DUF2760 domain-containing protein [Pirellulaceae bacterium]|nr:DUF2760 domain-containing protein [Pirellulaceae bacterium]